MAKFSEETFNNWRLPPSNSEEDKLSNAQRQVKEAINKDLNLNKLTIEIFGQGSYANDTNVRLNSDVDINVMYSDEFYFELPQGKTSSEFGITLSDKLSYSNYKDLVENALVNEFGRSNVKRNNKCIKILASPSRVECDVVPTFLYKRYSENKTYVEGVKLFSDSHETIESYPKQHTRNAIKKNSDTGRKYKRVTRIFKRLRYRMRDEQIAFPESITSFLIESLMWNVPNDIYNNNQRWSDIVRQSIIYLYEKTKSSENCKDWGEVSELLYLFYPARKWSVSDVNSYLVTLWNYLEFNS